MVQPQKIILELSQKNEFSFTGATHLYYPKNKYEHYKVNVTFNANDSTYSISEDTLLSVKLGFGAIRSAGTYKMKLECDDSICTLTGKWRTHSRVFFKYRTVDAFFTQRINKSPLMQKSKNNGSFFQKNESSPGRYSDIQSLIEINRNNADTVKIEICDNGVIDNDSISLYFDDTLIISKQVISITPITFYIPSEKIQPISRFKLIAESLGSIPPCTALMIIKFNNKIYEVNLSSNLEKDAVVEFFLKE